MQAHECGLSEECSQRHARQDELNNQIRDIHDALLGTALSNEPSIKEKVSEMYDERKAVKKWLAGTAVSIVVFIFTLGVIYEKFNHLTADLDHITTRINALENAHRK